MMRSMWAIPKQSPFLTTSKTISEKMDMLSIPFAFGLEQEKQLSEEQKNVSRDGGNDSSPLFFWVNVGQSFIRCAGISS